MIEQAVLVHCPSCENTHTLAECRLEETRVEDLHSVVCPVHGITLGVQSIVDTYHGVVLAYDLCVPAVIRTKFDLPGDG